MEVKDYLSYLTHEIHSTVFSTIDEEGRPHTCVIDIMLCDDNSIYFLTSRGKAFYNRLNQLPFVSLSGMKGNDTLSSVVISLRGKVREIGSSLVGQVFRNNPYMNKIYPKPESRNVLTVFQLYEGEGEFFDLTQQPPFREAFSFGGGKVKTAGYKILNTCTKCRACLEVCPSNCIKQDLLFYIREENCIHCGNCFAACSYSAITKK